MVYTAAMQRHMARATHGVDWRHQLATEHAARGEIRNRPEWDEATRQAVDFHRLRADAESGLIRARQKHPQLASAEAAWQDPTVRFFLQLLLLGNVDSDEICERLGLHPTVLQTIEDLYFDVRGMLTSPDWIVARFILREADAGRDDQAAQMRMAYFGGGFAAKALVDAKVQLPTEKPQQLADAALLLHAKFLQATEMPFNSDQLLQFLKLYAEIRREEQLLRLERDKLTFRIQRWTQRYELVRERSEREGIASAADRTVDETESPTSARTPSTATSQVTDAAA